MPGKPIPSQFSICPTLQDKHWDECIPKEIPYTIAAEKYKKKEFEGSAQVGFNLHIDEKPLCIFICVFVGLYLCICISVFIF